MPDSTQESHDATTVRALDGLRDIAGDLSLVICDLWGVMHNGLQVHPAAIEAITKVRDAGVASIFLSNAPRPRYHVRKQLIRMGMPDALTDYIVTSGGLARDAVRSSYKGAKLYHLGPEEDRNTVEGLSVDEVEHPDDAEVILATGLEFLDVERHRGLLLNASKRRVPFLCANPDRVVHVGDKLYTCAGAIADLYEAMDGPVQWFGKPTAESLHTCVSERGLSPDTDPNRVIMIGDSLQTDIAGAKAAGYGSLFIAGGIHREEWPLVEDTLQENELPKTAFQNIFGPAKPMPTFAMKFLEW